MSRSNAKGMQKYFASKMPGKVDGPSSIRANCPAMHLQASAWQHAHVHAATLYNVVLSRTGCMKLQDTWGTSIMLASNCHISGILEGVHEGELDQVQGGDAPGKDCHDGFCPCLHKNSLLCKISGLKHWVQQGHRIGIANREVNIFTHSRCQSWGEEFVREPCKKKKGTAKT